MSHFINELMLTFVFNIFVAFNGILINLLSHLFDVINHCFLSWMVMVGCTLGFMFCSHLKHTLF